MKYFVLVLALFCVSVDAQTIDERPYGYINVEIRISTYSYSGYLDVDDIVHIKGNESDISLYTSKYYSTGSSYYYSYKGTYLELAEEIKLAKSEIVGTSSSGSSFSMSDLANGMLAASQAFADYFNNK